MNEIDRKLELLFDQRLSDPEIDALRKELGDEEFDRQIQLHRKIEEALCDRFEFEPVDKHAHAEKVSLQINRIDHSRRLNVVRLAIGLAASLLLAITISFYWNGTTSTEVQFNRIPLAKLYVDSIERGFQPYYDCSDPERFASEFERRQGVELKLQSMPKNMAMLGVSYLGGISRSTTAVLFESNDQPVVVFVDTQDLELEELKDENKDTTSVSIHKTKKFGLIFYEVSELDKPIATDYFQLLDH